MKALLFFVLFIFQAVQASVKDASGRAQNLFAQGKYKEVIRLLAPHQDNLQLGSTLILAESYLLTKDALEAESILLRSYNRNPKNYNLLLLLARTSEARKDDNKAVKYLREATELHPKRTKAFEKLLKIFLKTKNNYEARILIETLMKRFGPKPIYQSLLCMTLTEDKYSDEAIKQCQRATIEDSGNPLNYSYLSQAYLQKDKKHAARRALVNGLNKFPKSTQLLMAMGQHELGNKNYLAAARRFKKAVDLGNKTPDAQIGLAEALFNTKKYIEAIPHFKNACKANRKYKSDIKKHTTILRQKKLTMELSQYETKLGSCLYN